MQTTSLQGSLGWKARLSESPWGLKGHPMAHAPGLVPGSPTPPPPGAVGP